MKRVWITLAMIASLAVLAVPASAQDYRGRLQGAITDSSGAALPGVTVTLTNIDTNVAATRVTDTQGRYLFDFVDPGAYTVLGELPGFKKADQRNVRVPQRGDVTVNLAMDVGGVEETVVVEAAPSSVKFTTSSSDFTIERQLVDQVPINGRNPYNLASLDPTVTLTLASENRPYHHAYANDYDAGGGTRRANDVLLDGVALGASYKTAYTPAMDAVDEVTVSKSSVDAENGHSLGGIISLNMKAGTNAMHGSAYLYSRDPKFNAIGDPTIRLTPGQDTTALRGSDLQMMGATFGGPIKRNKLFSFTSYERWNDKRPISIVRTVPTELERRGDFSQSILNGRVRNIFNPYASTLDPATGRVIRPQFAGNVIPSGMIDPVALKMLEAIPLPNVPGNVDNLQGSVTDNTEYWNFSQRLDLNINDNWKVFARYGQFKANLYQQNPTPDGFYPLSGSNRYGMSFAGDSVWVVSNKTTVNVRGSYYNMTDEFYNPSLLLGADGLKDYWSRSWYSSLYNSGYVYYPALDVTSGTGTGTTNRLGRQGREWYQHPDAWTMSARINRYEGPHSLKAGGEVRAYYGEAARFEPINLVFNSAMTANSSDSPDVTGTGNQWASFLVGGLDNQTTARLVPLQNPNLLGYAAYVQDDWIVGDRLSINLGVRWEYEPGPTDPDNRLSQRFDLTSPIPEMQTTPPNIPAQARQLMSSKGYSYLYNGAWVFASEDSPNAWSSSKSNFLPRIGASYKVSDKSAIRVAYARYLMPTSNVRDTLGDFVEQYAGFAQVTNTLGLANGVPRQTLADPFPATSNPVIEPYGQAYGRYTNLGGAANLDEYLLRPQVNDRFNFSLQKESVAGMTFDLSYFFNYGTRVPFDKDLNMMDPAFKYEQKTLLNTQVANPFLNYLTVDKFPGQLRNSSTVTLGSLLKPYPQYTSILQRNTNGRMLKTHTFEIRAQRPFTKGASFFVAYAWNNEKRQEWFDDIAQYEIFQTGEGWEWRTTDQPTHRVTAALTWLLPFGRERAYLSDMPTALDLIVGGWQYSASSRYYSGRPVFFNQSLVADGNPKVDNPTNDRWFDTSVFRGLQDTFTPRNNPWTYDGLVGPSVFITDMTLTKSFKLTPKYRLEARIETYNTFNAVVWDQPEVNVSSPNFGKVTRKRIDGIGREVQIGVRFVF
jgi:hypothetical protein